MKEILFDNNLFGFFITLFAYVFIYKYFKEKNILAFNPMVMSLIFLIGFLAIFKILKISRIPKDMTKCYHCKKSKKQGKRSRLLSNTFRFHLRLDLAHYFRQISISKKKISSAQAHLKSAGRLTKSPQWTKS